MTAAIPTAWHGGNISNRELLFYYGSAGDNSNRDSVCCRRLAQRGISNNI